MAGLRPKTKITTSAAEIGQLAFNEASYAQRFVEAGGVYEILGAGDTRKRCGKFSSLRIINTAGTWAYVKFGDNTVTAPTGLTDGHGIPPNSEAFLSSGEVGDYVIASAATVGLYKLVDNVVAIADDRDNK
jgi:hypothetical protein